MWYTTWTAPIFVPVKIEGLFNFKMDNYNKKLEERLPEIPHYETFVLLFI